VELGATEARLRASLYARGAVLADVPSDNGGWRLDLELDQRGYDDLCRRERVHVLAGPGGGQAGTSRQGGHNFLDRTHGLE
jgi:hypothetical protein